MVGLGSRVKGGDRMPVTARFVVSKVTPMGGYTKEDGEVVAPFATEVEMTPDYAEGRNKEWSKATPSGVMRLGITNDAALEVLKQGSHLAVTLEPIEE